MSKVRLIRSLILGFTVFGVHTNGSALPDQESREEASLSKSWYKKEGTIVVGSAVFVVLGTVVWRLLRPNNDGGNGSDGPPQDPQQGLVGNAEERDQQEDLSAQGAGAAKGPETGYKERRARLLEGTPEEQKRRLAALAERKAKATANDQARESALQERRRAEARRRREAYEKEQSRLAKRQARIAKQEEEQIRAYAEEGKLMQEREYQRRLISKTFEKSGIEPPSELAFSNTVYSLQKKSASMEEILGSLLLVTIQEHQLQRLQEDLQARLIGAMQEVVADDAKYGRASTETLIRRRRLFEGLGWLKTENKKQCILCLESRRLAILPCKTRTRNTDTGLCRKCLDGIFLQKGEPVCPCCRAPFFGGGGPEGAGAGTQ